VPAQSGDAEKTPARQEEEASPEEIASLCENKAEREMDAVETMGEIESSGSNVDEAIAAGLALLAVTREDVEVEVLDEAVVDC